MHFDIADLTAIFDSGTYQRGLAYAERGKVLAWHWEDDELVSEVEGSGREDYQQAIQLTRRGGRLVVDGACSCPVGYNCKHVVAALLASLARDDGALAQSDPGLTFAHDQWLRSLAQLNALTLLQPARNRTFVLAWILGSEPRTGIHRLHLCKARPGKHGGIGATTGGFDVGTLLRSPPPWLSPADHEPLRLFHAMCAGQGYGGVVRPEGAIGARLLRSLCAAGSLWHAPSMDDLRRGRVDPLRWDEPRRAALDWVGDAHDPASLRLRWRFADADGAAADAVLATDPPCYIDGDRIGELVLPALPVPAPLPMLLEVVAQAPALPAARRADLALRMAKAGLDRLVPAPPLQTTVRREVAPVPVLQLDSAMAIANDEWLDFALLDFDYDGAFTAGRPGKELQRIVGDGLEVIQRDLDAEAAATARLAQLGFVAAPADSALADLPGSLELADEAAWLAFERHAVPQLRADGWIIEPGGDYRYALAVVDDWYAELDEQDEGGSAWFALDLGIVVGGQRHALVPLLVQMIRSAPQHFDAPALAARADDSELLLELPDGTRVALAWNRIKPILATLGELYFGDRGGKKIYLPWMDAARLAELEQAARLRWVGGERLRELGRKLASFDGIAPAAIPDGLRAELRPYQRSGLAWLQFLREFGLGGILADDMGLGKTVQTLAHILAEKEAGRLDRPALVVAPTSLMPNWQAEAARFAPGLRVLLLHGKDRAALFGQIPQADLVLTTYPLLGRDEERLREHHFHLLILDEAQYIKNSRSKASQTARLLDARHRLCLTGTPVQNHLGELWSQFHFLMPGLLGDDKRFNAHYRKPIEQEGDSQRADLLARRLKPFMLRRTKDKVATELPPKTEIVLPVDLGGTQRDLYETVRVAMNKKVRDEIDRKGLARSQIVILDALLKLRQVCCDPRLLKREGSAVAAGSAKFDALLELLDTLLSEGRKVLVFSQFTSMLALIGDALRAREIDYVTLTGDTRDRAAPVAAFQGGQVGVFLISLKAGGVGLNLTAADTVIHYDPWWNPASENQATDRAWRIGQQQPVFVYKLIARGTLEEKIQEMQRRKGELANAMLSSETELAPGIDADQLREIFSLD